MPISQIQGISEGKTIDEKCHCCKKFTSSANSTFEEQVLSIFFSVGLPSDEVPTQWKTATVILIFKKGKRTDPRNYTPVSLTSVFSKVMERILSEDIT